MLLFSLIDFQATTLKLDESIPPDEKVPRGTSEINWDFPIHIGIFSVYSITFSSLLKELKLKMEEKKMFFSV